LKNVVSKKIFINSLYTYFLNGFVEVHYKK